MKSMKSVRLRIFTVLMVAVMVFGSVSTAFAAAPTKEDIEYEGAGKVDVEFTTKVNWKNPKITVKDSAGKTYTATIVKKDNDDITFKINKFKEGTKYSFTISGVKKSGTSGYGKVNGTVTIPASKKNAAKVTTKANSKATTKANSKATTKTTNKAAVSSGKTISYSTAKTNAVNAAVKSFAANKSTMRDFDIERDTYRGKKVWEVSFDAKRTGKTGWYEFEYYIDMTTGKVLGSKVERD